MSVVPLPARGECDDARDGRRAPDPARLAALADGLAAGALAADHGAAESA